MSGAGQSDQNPFERLVNDKIKRLNKLRKALEKELPVSSSQSQKIALQEKINNCLELWAYLVYIYKGPKPKASLLTEPTPELALDKALKEQLGQSPFRSENLEENFRFFQEILNNLGSDLTAANGPLVQTVSAPAGERPLIQKLVNFRRLFTDVETTLSSGPLSQTSAGQVLILINKASEMLSKIDPKSVLTLDALCQVVNNTSKTEAEKQEVINFLKELNSATSLRAFLKTKAPSVEFFVNKEGMHSIKKESVGIVEAAIVGAPTVATVNVATPSPAAGLGEQTTKQKVAKTGSNPVFQLSVEERSNKFKQCSNLMKKLESGSNKQDEANVQLFLKDLVQLLLASKYADGGQYLDEQGSLITRTENKIDHSGFPVLSADLHEMVAFALSLDCAGKTAGFNQEHAKLAEKRPYHLNGQVSTLAGNSLNHQYHLANILKTIHATEEHLGRPESVPKQWRDQAKCVLVVNAHNSARPAQGVVTVGVCNQGKKGPQHDHSAQRQP